MEIIQRLQKNLDILIQSMTRVSSRSEMLGAIHQVGSCVTHISPLFVVWWDEFRFLTCTYTTVLRLLNLARVDCRRIASVRRWRWWSSMWRTWGGCTPRSTPSCWSWERRSCRTSGRSARTQKGVRLVELARDTQHATKLQSLQWLAHQNLTNEFL